MIEPKTKEYNLPKPKAIKSKKNITYGTDV